VARVLVAGIGNIFLGDDGFGSETARRLMGRVWPEGVRVADFGIRGIDLAFALLEPYELVIFVDATRRGGEPGTLYLIEPDLDTVECGGIEAHAMTPERVLASAHAMGARLGRILIVGCEPESLEGIGLTPRVAAAVEGAMAIVEATARELESRVRTRCTNSPSR
jgi:hydrogenase maturation protease